MEFEVEEQGLVALGLARLMADIQHLCVMTAGLSGAYPLPPNHPAFGELTWKYTNALIDFRPGVLGDLEAYVVRIRQGSPLLVEILLKLPQSVLVAVGNAFRLVFDRFFFGEIERELRLIRVEEAYEEMLGRRLQNLATALELAAKIPDPVLRREFLDNLKYSIRPFHRDHPKLKSVQVLED